MGIVRAEVIARMRGAFRKGVSASRFVQDMREKGLAYRRTDMLSDWRSVNELEVKKGLMRYVRRDRYPALKAIAAVDYAMGKEYMFTVKVKSRIEAGQPITERFVNIMSDIPLTPIMIDEQVAEQWQQWEKYAAEEITELQVWSAIRQVME